MKDLEVIKDDLALYLKLSSHDKESFTYYMFDYQQVEFWNLVGLRYLKREPLLLDIKLMHIEQEERDDDEFVAEYNASGRITFDPDEYLKIITFFEQQVLQKEIIDEEYPLIYFAPMSADEMLQIRYPSNLLPNSVGRYYRYLPSAEAQIPEVVSVISLPSWSMRFGANQITGLRFAALTSQQLEDPHFNLLQNAGGLGTIRFNQQALEELVILLKRHTFRLS